MVKLAIQENTAAVMAATTPSQVYLHPPVHVQSMQGTSWECADGLASHAGPLLSLTRAQFRQAFLTSQLSICPSFVSAENDFACAAAAFGPPAAAASTASALEGPVTAAAVTGGQPVQS